MKTFRVELVWNREFNWCKFGKDRETFDEAMRVAIDIRDSGDGARVKKVRVLDNDDNKVLYQG